MNSKFSLICMLMTGIWLSSLLGAQTLLDDGEMTLYQSSHYEVLAESSLPATEVEAIVFELEANYTLFNEMFTSAVHRPENLLNVKIFASKDSFDQALTTQRIRDRSNYIYLYYDNPEENVLLIYPLEDEGNERAQLARHGFFSYIFDSLPTLPTWLREGLALYYESVIYNENGQAMVPYNRLYLDDLKQALQTSPLSLRDLMMLNDENWQFEKSSFERSLLYSWGIVNFLMFSNDVSYRQLITQAVAQVSAENTQEENCQALVNFIFGQKPSLQQDFDEFLNTTMGYVELVSKMRLAYVEKDYDNARSYAEQAQNVKPDAYVPEYYLGLISFENSQYAQAKNHYQKALELGAPQSLIDFAMGYVYYYGDKDYQQASATFQKAKADDPVRFGQKVDLLMKNLMQDSQSPYQHGNADSMQDNELLQQSAPVSTDNSKNQETLTQDANEKDGIQ